MHTCAGKQCWGSVTFRCRSGADPYLWLMYPDPDPILDHTPFFSNFNDANIFFVFFSYNLPAGALSSVFNFLLKFCVKILFCKHYFSPLNTFMRKGKDPDMDPDPYLWLMDPDPGALKTCESWGSGYPTLLGRFTVFWCRRIFTGVNKIQVKTKPDKQDKIGV
jgi:hypothetical protein